MRSLAIAPVLVPLVVAAVLLLLWRYRTLQRAVSLGGMLLLLGCAGALFVVVRRDGIQVAQLGSYPAPFGVTFVADLFSAVMLLAAATMGVAVTVYSLASIDRRREAFGYHPLLHLLLVGICGAFLTGDMFNLYVFFEVMLMASFVLLTLGGERGQIEGAIKYVTLNLISSAVFLAGVGLLYGVTGTLNMADLAVKLPSVERPELFTILAMLFLVAFGVKAAMFPLFFWLPASYHTPPPAVSAIFAALLTKVGVYSLVRVFTLIFTHDLATTHGVVLVLAGAGMLCGVLGAAAQNEVRRILAFHSVSQIGYMLMGLGLVGALAASESDATRAGVQLALAGTIVFIVHHLVVKGNLFLIGGVVERLGGSGRLKDLGGLYRTEPVLALLFLVSALSLAGIPPLSGFWAKYVLVRAALGLGGWMIVAAALVTGLLTLFSMVKIWAAAFWADVPEASPVRDPEARAAARRGMGGLLAPTAVLAAIIVLYGLAFEPIFAVAMDAAAQLLDPSGYVAAVRPAGGGAP